MGLHRSTCDLRRPDSCTGSIQGFYFRTKATLREKMNGQTNRRRDTFLLSMSQRVGPRAKPEPVRSTELPEAAWQEIAIYLLEINSGNHRFVVAVDYFS